MIDSALEDYLLMKIESLEEEGCSVVSVVEDLTYENFREFSESVDRLLDEGVMDLIIDLESVNYITSRGLGTIVGAYTVLKRRGGNLIISGANEDIKKSLRITHLDKIIPVVENRGMAVQLLKAPEAN